MSRPSPLLVAAAVIRRQNAILVARRKRGAHLERLWEFPGGKLEPGESPEECLVRELWEELGVSARVGRIRDVVFHRYPEKSVLLLFYECELLDGEPRALGCEEIAWVSKEDLPQLEWAPADVAFVKQLAAT